MFHHYRLYSSIRNFLYMILLDSHTTLAGDTRTPNFKSRRQITEGRCHFLRTTPKVNSRVGADVELRTPKMMGM